MILLFNHLPVTLERKIAEFIIRAKETYGSDFYNIAGEGWKGDNLTVDSLFPTWVLREAENDPENVAIVQIVKSYLRWLFSSEYGYGAYIEWETIQVPQKISDSILEGLADKYFPGADFSSTSDNRDLLQNLKKFSIQSDANYFNVKGSQQAIKYLLTTLLDLPQDDVTISTSSAGFFTVKANVLDKYKPFLDQHVYPAGTVVLYEAP